MKRALSKAGLGIGVISIGLMSLFQNCGPAKLVGGDTGGSADHASTPTSIPAPSTVGNKVDLANLLNSSQEPVANIAYLPSTFGRGGGSYAEGMPIFENFILNTNDFSLIQWIQESSSIVMAEGLSLDRLNFSTANGGKYYIIGYRGEVPYMISSFYIINKGSTTQSVNTAGAVKINQRFIGTVGDIQSTLLEVDASNSELKSIRYSLASTGEVIDSRRGILVKKKASESLSIEIKLIDSGGQTYSNTVILAASAP